MPSTYRGTLPQHSAGRGHNDLFTSKVNEPDNLVGARVLESVLHAAPFWRCTGTLRLIDPPRRFDLRIRPVFGHEMGSLLYFEADSKIT